MRCSATSGRLGYVGNVEDESGRTDVVLDGRPASLVALGEARIASDAPVQLKHVSDIEFGTAQARSLFRVNAEPAVGVYIFQEGGANLVRLGGELRTRVAAVREEMAPLGIDLVIGSDAADEVESQLGRLARLGATGYLIALAVLFLFLRQWRRWRVGVRCPFKRACSRRSVPLPARPVARFISLLDSPGGGSAVDNSVVV